MTSIRPDVRSEFIVLGYIRNMESILTIPMDIWYLCLAYYYFPEFFDQARSDHFEISDDRLTISNVEYCDFCNHSIYGKQRIDSMSTDIISWKLQINECFSPNGYSIVIGITSGEIKINDDFNNKSTFSYSLNNNGVTEKNGNPDFDHCDEENYSFKKADVVIFKLDLKNATLSFKKNDCDENIIHQNIQKSVNIKYIMVLQLRHTHDSLTILDFITSNQE